MSTNSNENAFILQGNSMHPFIEPGSRVFMESISVQEYRKGDIICFIKDLPTVFAHRLVKKTIANWIPCFLEKGDNVYGFSAVPVNRILGRLIKIEQNNKIINLNSSYWKTVNYLLALIASLQVVLLKLLPYSYQRDPLLKRIPHYALKLVFRFILYLSMSLRGIATAIRSNP